MWLSRVLHARGARRAAAISAAVQEIEDHAVDARRMSSAELAATAAALRDRLDRGQPLESMTTQLYGRLKESARRGLGEDARPNQLRGALAMLSGAVAELPTGEGKTLAATFPAALWALEGDGVHLMTVNEYLARRDADWMRPVFAGIGLSAAVAREGDTIAEKRQAYAADLTYGTNLEIGFDYLRDGLVGSPAQARQRPLASVILDEADSLLIDEARIPLVLSGPAASFGIEPYRATAAVEALQPGVDFEADYRRHMVWLTEPGVDRVERFFEASLYELDGQDLLRHVNHALRARVLHRRDVDYVVGDGEVLLVDEYTGRAVPGRRWSDGLHQAVEAKERLELSRPRTTYAQITMRSLVKLYRRVAGMTATATEVRPELDDIYGLDVVVVASHVASRRVDHHDEVFEAESDKLAAALSLVEGRHRRGQPVLVGCGTVTASEQISRLLADRGVPHAVLNARDDDREAEIVAAAGVPGTVTVATHLAGRGVDIKLGGSSVDPALADKAADLGGLCVVGTERYESARIERQLRGRAGRQGEPGESHFFVSPADPMVAAWAPRVDGLAPRRRLAYAQSALALRNDALRRDTLAFDEVFERHRTWARERREAILTTRPEELERFDQRWVEHLAALFDLLDAIHFRAWGAEIPLAAWHRESGLLFRELTSGAVAPPERADEGERTDGDASEWLDRLGPRAEEAELDDDSEPLRARSVSSFQPVMGAGFPLGVVVVADVDGGRTR